MSDRIAHVGDPPDDISGGTLGTPVGIDGGIIDDGIIDDGIVDDHGEGPRLAVEADPDRWRPWFYVFVGVGLVVALVLGIREVVVEPVIKLDDVRGSDRGVLPVQAQVLALNTSGDQTYCVTIEISASDRDGRSLSTKVAEPTTGDGELAPGRSANFVAVFDDLTDQEIDEELDSFYAFVTDRRQC